MGVTRSLFGITLFILKLCLFASDANAIALQYLSSATELETLLPNPLFVAEGQIGSIALNTYPELESWNGRFNPGSSFLEEDTENQIDFAWSSSKKQPFSLTYDGSLIRYTVGKKTLKSTTTGSSKDIFIITKATEKGSSTLLDSLKLKDSLMTLSISSLAATERNGRLTIFRVHDIEGAFTLTGHATLNWTNQPENRANIAYQIRAGDVNASNNVPPTQNVPEPSPLVGLTFSTLVVAFYTYRHSNGA